MKVKESVSELLYIFIVVLSPNNARCKYRDPASSVLKIAPLKIELFDSVEVALVLIRTTGKSLMLTSPAGLHAVMERLRQLLHEGGKINKRVQYQVQELLQLRKRNLEELASPIIPELDLVERDEQITLECSLDYDNDDDDKLPTHLDIFHYDPNWDETELLWKQI